MSDENLVSDDALREEVRAWLAERWNPERALAFVGEHLNWNTSDEMKAWASEVVEARWAVPSWPVEWFGRGSTISQSKIIAQEFERVQAPCAGQDFSSLYGNTLLGRGSEALKNKLLEPILKGEVDMCLLYSEPGAGSDLAGIRTRADLRGDHYVVNGQKVWSSGAMESDYGMLIARTDWDVPKHAGISFFFLPLKQPGVDVRPLRQITDESHFNEVFITDAIVPAENIVGEVNTGWKVLQTALAYERLSMGDATTARSSDIAAKESLKEEVLVALAREAGVLDDPVLRQKIAQAIAYQKLNELTGKRVEAEVKQGMTSPAMSLGKLAMSRVLHEEARVRTAILGAQSLFEGDDYPRAKDTNFLTLQAYLTSIGGGTDQIQRNIIGERVLGLPKEPEVDKAIPFREVRKS